MMNRTFRLARKRRFSYLTACLMVPTLLAAVLAGPHRDKVLSSISLRPWDAAIIALLLVISGAVLLLMCLYERVVTTDDGISSFDILNRPKFHVPYSELIAYRRKEDDVWRLSTEVREYRLPEIDFIDFHTAIVANAPRALNAKRWKSGQLPPSQNFQSLALFDGRNWISHLLAAGIIGIPLMWVIGIASIGVLAMPVFSAIYDMKDLFGSLSLDEGGSLRSGLGNRIRSLGKTSRPCLARFGVGDGISS